MRLTIKEKSKITKELNSGISINYDKWREWKGLPKSATYEKIKWIFENPSNTNLAIRHILKYGLDYVTEDKFNTLVENNVNSYYTIVRTYYPKDQAEKLILENTSLRNSMYCPNYVSKRDSISLEEAKAKINIMKANKATNLSGFISRHGKDKGVLLYNKFRKNSDSKSLKFYIGKYGVEAGTIKFNKDRFLTSKRCIDYWINKGFSKEEAINKVSTYQRNTSGVHTEYWKNIGYSSVEAAKIVNLIHSNKPGFTNLSYDLLLNEYKIDADFAICLMRILKTGLDYYNGIVDINPLLYNGYMNSKNKLKFLLDNKDLVYEFNLTLDRYKLDFDYYKDLVNVYTKISLKTNNVTHQDNLELDHKYSIWLGYVNGINPEIIGSIHNLEFISGSANSSKGSKSSIELEELIRLYKET